MQYMLSREELDTYVTKDEYNELQVVVDQRDAKIEQFWTAIDKLPENAKAEFIKNAGVQSEFASREIGKVMNPIVQAEMKTYVEKATRTMDMMRGRGVFTTGEVAE